MMNKKGLVGIFSYSNKYGKGKQKGWEHKKELVGKK